MHYSIKGFIISLAAHAVLLAGAVLVSFILHRSEDISPILENSGLTFTVAEMPISPNDVQNEVKEEAVTPIEATKPIAGKLPVEETAIPPIAPETKEIKDDIIEPVLKAQSAKNVKPAAKPIAAADDAVAKKTDITPSVAAEKIDIADKAEKSGARIEKPAMPTQPITVNYPRRARRAGLEGDVTLSVLVGVDGAVKAVDVISGTGFDVLDNAAEKAIWNARFTPATIDGIAVEASVSQVVSFRLRD